jgi:DtxR family transcriptional regulator, Mn-dependent transcriptional regulator
MPGRITVSKEDYLKAVLEAECEGGSVIGATLAHRLSVSAPAVTMALRRLRRDGLLRVHENGRVELTTTGRRIARRTVTRHHLIERMLAEIFAMEWYRVHDEAERLEHAVSPVFEAKMAALLGRGGRCPHGNLSEPESAASRRRRGLIPLLEAEPSRTYSVSAVDERDRRLLEYLDQHGLRPGTILRVLGRGGDHRLKLNVPPLNTSIPIAAAAKVWVRTNRKVNRA